MKMDIDAKYGVVCIAAMLLLMPVAGWGSYYEDFNTNDGGWESLGPGGSPGWDATTGIGASGAIQCRALGEAKTGEWQIGGTGAYVWRPFWTPNTTLNVNFATDSSITSYFSKGTICEPGSNQLYFYLGDGSSYYYWNPTPATLNATETWATPTTLTLDSTSSNWTWMGTGTDPGFSPDLLTSADEFGWALVGPTAPISGSAYMDDFSATPTPAAAVLFPIGAAAVLWARRRRQVQQDSHAPSTSAEVPS